ncbi:hypothetical protein EPR50_G00082100 [Perca flavescens]|uniref:Uncharacterized protein n=1 Tax=Perca flavescens TaxID=8167 RepID=A0A484D756_PERFV|nr:uncharacterized protein LOC114559128 isoform X1 [Perca flavescens]XP_028439403.1 uncharacterized protein LOC114559128 isoform X1 [Perca flavescens]TDH11111.1 hypothetical protein EPR50_G00082100 [Perca flavescens]
MCRVRNRKCMSDVGLCSDGPSCRLSVDANCTAEMENRRIHLACGRFCTYVAVIAVFILFGSNFECACKPQVFDCKVYQVLPVFIVFLLILWTDGSFQSVGRLLCSGVSRGTHTHTLSFWDSFFYHIIKAAFIGLLWVVVVLIDGDWYVCCQNDGSEQQRQLACRAVETITEEERVTIAELRNKSRVIGSFLLLGIVCVPALMASLRWRKCSRRKQFEKLMLEEEEKVLKEILRKSAKERLSRAIEDRVRRSRWEECSDVAADLITSEEIFPEHEERHPPQET